LHHEEGIASCLVEDAKRQGFDLILTTAEQFGQHLVDIVRAEAVEDNLGQSCPGAANGWAVIRMTGNCG
jgi:hypothetical protein